MKRNSKHSSKKVKILSSKTDASNERCTDLVMSTFFNSSNPRFKKAWDDLFFQYLETIEFKHHDFFKVIVELDKCLVSDQKMRVISLLFRRIVPTIAPSDFSPLEFLKESIADAEAHNDFSKLYVFIQIATIKIKEIEKRIKDKGTNKILLLHRDKEEEKRILEPLFSLILTGSMGYSDSFQKNIIPEIVKHKDYLIETLNKYISGKGRKARDENNKTKYQKTVNKIIDAYSRLEDYQEKKDHMKKNESTVKKMEEKIEGTIKEIEDLVNQITILRTSYYRTKYYDWKKETEKNGSRYLFLDSARIIIPKSYVENVFWFPLSSWPINDYLRESSAQEYTKFDIEASPMLLCWTVIN